MKRLPYTLLLCLILLSCVGCDQVTKSVAKEHLPRGRTISLLDDTVRLMYAENPGAFLSLGATLPERIRTPLFTIGGFVLVLVVLVALLVMPRLSPLMTFGITLTCGGGFSNLIDRVYYSGHVIDFLNVGIGPLRTGIFNVADMAIMIGTVFILVSAAASKRSNNGHSKEVC